MIVTHSIMMLKALLIVVNATEHCFSEPRVQKLLTLFDRGVIADR